MSNTMALAEELLNLPFVQGKVRTTEENLRSALFVEDFVADRWFPALAQGARDEGREDLARMFEQIGHGEKTHAAALRAALASIGTR